MSSKLCNLTAKNYYDFQSKFECDLILMAVLTWTVTRQFQGVCIIRPFAAILLSVA